MIKNVLALWNRVLAFLYSRVQAARRNKGAGLVRGGKFRGDFFK
jgi:hypothetical protein